jgi:hypothetical protein
MEAFLHLWSIRKYLYLVNYAVSMKKLVLCGKKSPLHIKFSDTFLQGSSGEQSENLLVKTQTFNKSIRI